MATLTKEQIDALNAYYGGGSSGWSQGMNQVYQDPQGQYIQDNGGNGYRSYTKSEVGDTYNKYGYDGSDQGQAKFTSAGNPLKEWALMAGALALGGGAAGLWGGAGAAPGVVAGDAFLPGALGADGALMPSTLQGLEGYLATGAAVPGPGAGGGGASGLLNSKLLGPAAAIAGGVLGGKGGAGGGAEGSMTKEIPEWLKPGVMNLLGKGDSLLNQQMAPGAMPGWEQMRKQSMGLLSQPVAGNGFERFYGSK